jgi:hypothetical protein
MGMNLSILLDWLEEYDPRKNFLPGVDENPIFDDVRICHEGMKEFMSSTLYVCMNGILPQIAKPEECYFVCLSAFDKAIPGNFIGISFNGGELKFYDIIRDCFQRFNRWISAVDNALLREEPLQNLVDISENVLPNPIIILDGASIYLAGTQNIVEDDEIYHSIKLRGRADPVKVMEIITSVKYDKQVEFSDGQNYYLSDDVFGFPEIFWNYYQDGLVRASIFSKFSLKQRTQGYIDLFCTFLLKVKIALFREHIKAGYFQTTDYPFQQIIQGRDVETAAKMIRFPMEGEFVVIGITSKWDIDAIGRTISYVIDQIDALLPESRTFTYDGKMYILLCFDSQNRDTDIFWEYQEQRLEIALAKLDTCCGMSNKFHELSDLKYGCIQADKALELSSRAANHVTMLGEAVRRITRYSDVGMYHVIEVFLESNPLEKYFDSAFLEMRKYDKEQNTKYCEILRRYLLNDRKVSVVSREMFMHRNNVIYHLNRIKERFGINYDSVDEKLYLLFCTVACEYIEGL